MANFLFIHGGFHGAWCWQSLITYLGGKNHQCYVLDLPGHGRDQTPRAEVDLDCYVSAVRKFITANDLSNLTVVGHSLAGIILPEIARLQSEKIDQLIFLAALVLEQGEAAIDLIPKDRVPSYFEMAERSEERSLFFDYEVAKKLFFSDFSEDEARSAYEQLNPQPFQVYLGKSTVFPKSIRQKCSYILCTEDCALPKELCLSLSRKLGSEAVEINSGHNVMMSNTEELGDLLGSLVEDRTVVNDTAE